MDGLMSQRATIKKNLLCYYHQNVVRFAGKNFSGLDPSFNIWRKISQAKNYSVIQTETTMCFKVASFCKSNKIGNDADQPNAINDLSNDVIFTYSNAAAIAVAAN